MSGDSVRVCQSDGHLSEEAMTCAKVQCGSLPSVPNSHFNITSSDGFDDVITYSCKEGFKLLGGSTVRECQDDKQWSGSPLVCEEITCGAPTSVNNATYTVTEMTVNSIAK